MRVTVIGLAIVLGMFLLLSGCSRKAQPCVGVEPSYTIPGDGKLFFLQKDSVEICNIDSHGRGHVSKGHTLKECTDEIFKDQ